MFKLAKNRMKIVPVIFAVLFMIVQVTCDLNLPNLTSDIINNGVAKGDTNYIWSVGIKMLAVSAIGMLAAVGNVILASRQSQLLGKNLRSDIYKKVSYFSNDEFDQIGTASLITRSTNDVVQIQNVAMMFLRMMIMAPIMLVGASVFAYQKDQHLTSIFLVVLPLMAIFIGTVMYFSVPLFKSMQKKTDRLNLVFREGLTGVRVIRAFNRDRFEQDRFDEANNDYMQTSVKVNNIMAAMLPVMTLIMSGTNIAIVWFGGHLIADKTMEVGNMIAFMTYATQILMSFMMLAMVFVFVPRAQASAVRIREVLSMNNPIAESKDAHPLATQEKALSFDHVDFRYRGAEELCLTDIDFSVVGGQTVSIIGGTGSGKSSLINLIPRFYDVEKGVIKIDNQDIHELALKDVHQAVAMVPQKANLFTGTIRDNLKYGNPEATDDQLWHALEIAQAKDFVEEMDKGLDSHVEQGGGNFSGGQKQRLSIARALTKKASIYVFDDSFSALDFKTDANLRAALKQDEEIREAVVVIVAQRISTVVESDLILVVEEGKVVGQGTHEQLKATNETYQEIISSQLREEDI